MRDSAFDMGQPCDVVRAARRAHGRPVLSQVDGEPVRLADYADRPLAVPACLVSGAQIGQAVGARGVVVDLYHGDDVRWKDVVAGFLVQAQRLVGRDDGQHEASVVLCRPGVAETLDLESESFAPVFRCDRDALGDGYRAQGHLCGVLDAVRHESVGCLFVWHDECTCYEAVISPRAYQRRPERVVIVDEGLWQTVVPAMLDLFGQQRPDHVCLHLRFDGPDVNAGGWMCREYGAGRVRRWLMDGAPSAQEVLDSFERSHATDDRRCS